MTTKLFIKKGKPNSNADALSRIQLITIETDSVVNNPGDVNQDVTDFLKYLDGLESPNLQQPNPEFDITNDFGVTQNLNQNNNYTINQSQRPRINIISDIQIKPQL